MRRVWNLLLVLSARLVIREIHGWSIADAHFDGAAGEQHGSGKAQAPGWVLIAADQSLPCRPVIKHRTLVRGPQPAVSPTDAEKVDLPSRCLPVLTAPPELRATWQFTRRAALLPRAPSRVS